VLAGVIMIKKLVKHGNSSALIIDKPIIEMLHIDENTNLELSTDGVNIIISPVNGINRTNMLKNSLQKINEKHSKTLKKLAK
jgi:antitoxin component of MazEF toxin-antitoxin module